VISALLDLFFAICGLGESDAESPGGRWFRNLESTDGQEPKGASPGIPDNKAMEKPPSPVDKTTAARRASALDKEFWETQQ